MLMMVGALESRSPSTTKGNVHHGMIPSAAKLADALRERSYWVDGLFELEEEDHTTMKFAFISRTLVWWARMQTSPVPQR